MNDKSNEIYHWLAQQLREGAEAQLAHTYHEPPADKILHELQVHQIELEMQNEELRRMQLALEVSRDRYIDLYEFAPISYLTLNKNCVITEANFTSATLLGVERSKLLNQRFTTYIIPEDKDRWHLHFLYSKQQDDKQSIELTLRRADRTRLVVHIDCLAIKKPDEPLMLRITMVDITQRKKAEESLRIAAVAFEIQTGILITDAHKIIISANKAFTHIFGYSAEEVIGRTPFFLRDELHDDIFYSNVWDSIARVGYWQGEVWDKRKNGVIFPVWMTVAAVADSNGIHTHYVGSFTDITVQKQAEQVLLDTREELEHQVTSTQEELEKVKDESLRINDALTVLLRYREADKFEVQDALSREVEGSVLPFLKKLKRQVSHKDQVHLIDVVQNNLQQLVTSYGRDTRLSCIYQKLTPSEIQVASMIRQGLSTKMIAMTLQISTGTIAIHRKHIRKKLGLNGCDDNLYSYLLSLDE
jgi:PAS domain S-box-containing protein